MYDLQCLTGKIEHIYISVCVVNRNETLDELYAGILAKSKCPKL